MSVIRHSFITLPCVILICGSLSTDCWLSILPSRAAVILIVEDAFAENLPAGTISTWRYVCLQPVLQLQCKWIWSQIVQVSCSLECEIWFATVRWALWEDSEATRPPYLCTQAYCNNIKKMSISEIWYPLCAAMYTDRCSPVLINSKKRKVCFFIDTRHKEAHRNQ